MRYTTDHKRWGPYFRKLREDHIEILYSLYKNYGVGPWRTDAEELYKDRSRRQYFLERMSWTFKFIKTTKISEQEKEKLKSNEKQMRHYEITPLGLKVLVQLNYKIKDEHVAFAAIEALRS